MKIFLTFFSACLKKDHEPDPDPYLVLMDPDRDPGGPKTYGSCGSGSATLMVTIFRPGRGNHSRGSEGILRPVWAGRPSQAVRTSRTQRQKGRIFNFLSPRLRHLVIPIRVH